MMLKRVLLVLIAAFMISCSAKIEPYYTEYVMEMRNSSGVDVKLFMQKGSPLPDGLLLRNGENVKWRTNSGIYAWPFDNVDTISNDVHYGDIRIVKYGTKKDMTAARNPGDVTNYVKEKLNDFTYSLVYTFTETDANPPKK